MSVPIPSFGFDNTTVVTSPSVPARKGKTSSAKKPLSPKQQEAIMTAKVNADVGNNIRWDVVLQEITEVAPAPPRHVTPVIKTIIPLKINKAAEDSTSAGETTDSDFSVSDGDSSPTAAFRPPPGLCAPPGLSGPPGLNFEEDCPPPPGFESFPALTASAP